MKGKAPIERISLREIALPLREPFATSHGTMVDRRLLLLHLEPADLIMWNPICFA